jgi:hypothetical protein
MAKLPPLLPPRPLVPEPFREWDKGGDTLREGLTRDPRDRLITEMQATIETLKVALGQEAEEQAPETQPSQLALRRQQQLAAAKMTLKSLAVLLLPILGGVVAKHWPEYSVFVDWASSLVGL